MNDRDILEMLVKQDPVYGPISVYDGPPDPSQAFDDPKRKKVSVRICALCGMRSRHNEENVTHVANVDHGRGCAWMLARLHLGHIHPET